VQKEATKALRFGLDDNWLNRGTQADRIVHEFVDLMSIYEMLIQEGHLNVVSITDSLAMVAAKKVRVEKYIGYAKERGTLVE